MQCFHTDSRTFRGWLESVRNLRAVFLCEKVEAANLRKQNQSGIPGRLTQCIGSEESGSCGRAGRVERLILVHCVMYWVASCHNGGRQFPRGNYPRGGPFGRAGYVISKSKNGGRRSGTARNIAKHYEFPLNSGGELHSIRILFYSPGGNPTGAGPSGGAGNGRTLSGTGAGAGSTGKRGPCAVAA